MIFDEKALFDRFNRTIAPVIVSVAISALTFPLHVLNGLVNDTFYGGGA